MRKFKITFVIDDYAKYNKCVTLETLKGLYEELLLLRLHTSLEVTNFEEVLGYDTNPNSDFIERPKTQTPLVS